jgi:alanyl-tRNA synthetase
MGKHYTEISDRCESITDAVLNEEDKFLSTLSRGLTLIDMAVKTAKDDKKNSIDGKTAFELYDTYGFPYELAEEVVGREGLSLDREGFEEAMEEARQIAREGAKMKGDIFSGGPLAEVKKITGETEFLGYDNLEAPAKVIAIVKGEELVKEAKGGDEVSIIMDKTAFYGESGGQIGDTGSIVGANNLVIEVIDTQKIDGIFIHVGSVQSGSIKVDDTVNCEVESERRRAISRNHTATHLLHWALHMVVGEKAEQKGSWVGPDRMRFDFNHNQALTRAEIEKVEELVNIRILENAEVSTKITDIDSAREEGAMALFGEKYGSEVRMVKVGDFSTELCGGCHVKRSGDIGMVKILSEESVAAGVRRIEACSGIAAVRVSRNESNMLSNLAIDLKSPVREIPEKVAALSEEMRKLQKEIASVRQAGLGSVIADAVKDAKETEGIKYLTINLGEVDGKAMRNCADEVRKNFTSGVALLGGASDGKVSLLCVVSKDCIDAGIKAGAIIAQAAEIVGGKGGGRPDMAQAGGKNPEKLEDALNSLPEILKGVKA